MGQGHIQMSNVQKLAFQIMSYIGQILSITFLNPWDSRSGRKFSFLSKPSNHAHRHVYIGPGRHAPFIAFIDLICPINVSKGKCLV